MKTMQIEKKILIIDDDSRNIFALKAVLSAKKYSCLAAISAEEGFELIKKNTDIGVILLDMMMPDMDGFTVARRMRERNIKVPILFLTARDDMEAKIQGLTVGGDDYVTKPFGLEEVVARIRAILRRTQNVEPERSHILQLADLILDEDAYEVRRAGQEIELSPTEFKLLRYLMVNSGRVVSKSQILDHVWEYDWNGDAAIVESYISYLRRKIDQLKGPDGGKVTPLIQTRRGVGYMMREPKDS